jgi:DNA-binding transcriptional LysR family regulator
MDYPNFKQLNALRLVSRMGSVSRAAQELHLTQPAVSLQLQLLEEATSTPLTRKVGRGIQLTAAGEVMADYAERMIALWNEAGDELAALKGVISGTLRIGAVTTAEYLLPPMLVIFTTDRPDVRIQLKVGNRDEIVSMLGRHEIDLAIMGTPPREFRTIAAPFAKHPMAFVASLSHPLMAKKKVSLEEVMDANMLVRERGSGTRMAVERLYKEADCPLRIGSELSSNEAIKRMVVAGLGVAFLSVHACTLEFAAGLMGLLPVANSPIENDWYVMHRADSPIPKVAAAFMDFIIEQGQGEVHRQLLAFYNETARSTPDKQVHKKKNKPA